MLSFDWRFHVKYETVAVEVAYNFLNFFRAHMDRKIPPANTHTKVYCDCPPFFHNQALDWLFLSTVEYMRK